MADDSTAADGHGADYEVLSPYELVTLFMEGWTNERLAPEILPHLGEYADCMMEQVAHMEENVSRLNKRDVRRGMHKFELQRMQFLLNNYFRTRVDKIEMSALKILQDDNSRDKNSRYLSPGERNFAKEYLQHCNRLFSSILGRDPTLVTPLNMNQAIVEPDLDMPVFIRVKKECVVVVPDDSEGREEEIRLETNSQHILPYRCVMEMVKNGDVKLI